MLLGQNLFRLVFDVLDYMKEIYEGFFSLLNGKIGGKSRPKRPDLIIES